MTDTMDCATCGKELTPTDKVARVLGSGATGTDIVCRDCAKKGGVDVGAFCKPLAEFDI